MRGWVGMGGSIGKVEGDGIWPDLKEEGGALFATWRRG